MLFPASGPPASRTITVRGGNLPGASDIQLIWSPGGHVSPILQTAYSDRKGGLFGRLFIPAAPPGRYEVIAETNGYAVAAARYNVVSRAVLAVRVLPGAQGDTLHVNGRHFLPNLKLNLYVYPMFQGPKPALIGSARTDAHGSFGSLDFQPSLVPGQYVLRAWSADALSSQMAETFFQVVV